MFFLLSYEIFYFNKITFSKNWDLRHTEDISAAVVRTSETLATSSYVGELILWRLETGQPYKKFNVSNPTARIKIHYQLKQKEVKPREDIMVRKKTHSSRSRSSLVPSIATPSPSIETSILAGDSILYFLL